MPQLDLSERHLGMVMDLLQLHVPGAEVWAHGSRVRGTSHEGSDLDLALRAANGDSVDYASLAKLRSALRDSDLPILVDVFDWPRLPERYKTDIERDHVALLTPSPTLNSV